MPLAFHPAATFIKSRIDRTRELACDEIAARSAETPSAYARSLLNIARGIVAAPAPATRFTIALFDSDSLEQRIRSLLDAGPRLSRRAGEWLLVSTTVLLGAASMSAATMSVRVASNGGAQQFAGDWVADFHGHRFFSMHLEMNGAKLTGRIRHFSIEVDGNGELTKAEERKGFTPIADMRVDGSVLHIIGEDRATTTAGHADQIELDLSILAQDRGEIRIQGGPVKPWVVQRQ